MQSRFLDRIGGSNRVRDSLSDALADGSRGVTAKVRWLPHAVPDLESAHAEGRPRWIHCTPLLGQSGAVGVWMVVLVDEKDHSQPVRRFRQAPPVSNDIRSKRSQYNRFDGYDDDDDAFSMRGPGVTPYGTGIARNMTIESLRQPNSPRMMHDQRALRSASSSIKDYVNGREASTDSFAI